MSLLGWLRRRGTEPSAAYTRLLGMMAYTSAWLAMANRLFPSERDLSLDQCDAVTLRTDTLIRVFERGAEIAGAIPGPLVPASSATPSAESLAPSQPFPGQYL
jgi:hypothetical protein